MDWICKHGVGLEKGGFVKHRFVRGGFLKHGFLKTEFVKTDNLKLKPKMRTVRIFFSFALIKSETVQ